MKPGYQTTEFWLTMIPTVVGMLAAVGIVAPQHASELTSAITTIVGGIAAIVPAVVYVINRTYLKSIK